MFVKCCITCVPNFSLLLIQFLPRFILMLVKLFLREGTNKTMNFESAWAWVWILDLVVTGH